MIQAYSGAGVGGGPSAPATPQVRESEHCAPACARRLAMQMSLAVHNMKGASTPTAGVTPQVRE